MLLLFPLGCVLRNITLCSVFVLTMQLCEKAADDKTVHVSVKGRERCKYTSVSGHIQVCLAVLAFYVLFFVSFLLCFSFFSDCDIITHCLSWNVL